MKKIFLFVTLSMLWTGSAFATLPREPYFGGSNIIGADLSDSWTTNWYRVNIKTDDGVTLTKPSNFDNKVSSTTAGKMTSSGTVTFNCDTYEIGLQNIGAESSVISNYWYGTVYLSNGMADNISFDVPVSTSFWMTATLGSGSTIYYVIRGAK